MSTRRHIPTDTLEHQATASNPDYSVWVSAHAGSGKTHVLSQRVVRLLLGGTEPSRILCLTYTRAAAANMANRIFRDLGRWAMLDDEALRREIETVEGRPADAETIRRARRLFARALETPGGLKIQTIHAFCEALLHQFPLEANIAGHFELLEGQAAAVLVAEARRELLVSTSGDVDPELAEAFAVVLERAGEFGLERLLDEIVSKRDDLRAMIDDLHGRDLAEDYGFAPEDTAETLSLGIWPDAYFDAALAAEVAHCAASKVRAADFAHALKLACESAPAARFAALCKAFLTDKGEARKPGQIAVKDVVARLPDFADQFTRMAEALVACRDRIALLDMVRATRAALVIADRLIGNYARLKHAGGYLDFDDLIRRTVALLSREDAGPWVRYRLDQGIDHILVDEAQDTSPSQWAVINQLADEFFVGESARSDITRTVFAVGDEKQSIYSFQGAEPEAFDHNRHIFRQRAEAALRVFKPVKLTYSFRSTEDVLRAVDLVFGHEDSRRGLTPDGVSFEHKAIRAGEPGDVEVWPYLRPTVVEEPDDWRVAIDHASAPAVQLANAIATRIETWLKSGAMLERDKRRPIRPGDIMVLVRKRDSFIHALSRALKERRIPVAGADRLSLPGHIAVQDLIALGRVVLQPDDDLSLAALLKSPIFGLDEDALFSLAHGRGEAVSLYASLRRAAAGDEIFKAVLDQLEQWRNEAGFRPAFEFYANVLGRDRVRHKLVSRLGHEAGEVLDEFQTFLLNAERTAPPDLESVLALLDAAGPDIKREMDQTRNEIRIMTVHAAKGLEAPVVFLVDSGGEAFNQSHLPRLLSHEIAGRPAARRFLWRASSSMKNSTAQAIEERLKGKAEEEYRRLLYVGMTRAEDRLVVCGYHGARGPKNPTWLSMVTQGLAADPATERVPQPDGSEVLRFRITKSDAKPAASAAETQPVSRELPGFLRKPLPPAPRLPRPLAPSRASAIIAPVPDDTVADRSPVLDPEEAPSLAATRGTAIHRLLQLLPELDPERHEATAMRFLERAGAAWQPAEREAACASVLAILRDSRFASLFGPGSRAEVSVMGALEIGGTPHAIAGTIDRLCVGETSILILDYKTNRPPPVTLAQVSPAYVTQLALYRALLAPLYPGHAIEAALLYTEAPRLIPVPAEAMDQALAGLASASDGLPRSGSRDNRAA